MPDPTEFSADWLERGVKGLFSVLIPAHDEAENIPVTVGALYEALRAADIDHEILVVEDHSTDETAARLADLTGEIPTLRWVSNPHPPGFGWAVRAGLGEMKGDRVAIVMADNSERPEDLVAYARALDEGYDCVFGSRFIRGGEVVDYPVHKLMLNRLANNLVRLLFGIRFNDTTNAFKGYRRHVIRGLQPLLAHHFNLTVELPLKAIIRGYSYCVVPIGWRNRKHGISKLRIREMGSRYLFIVLYCFIERHLSRGDYRRNDGQD